MGRRALVHTLQGTTSKPGLRLQLAVACLSSLVCLEAIGRVDEPQDSTLQTQPYRRPTDKLVDLVSIEGINSVNSGSIAALGERVIRERQTRMDETQYPASQMHTHFRPTERNVDLTSSEDISSIEGGSIAALNERVIRERQTRMDETQDAALQTQPRPHPTEKYDDLVSNDGIDSIDSGSIAALNERVIRERQARGSARRTSQSTTDADVVKETSVDSELEANGFAQRTGYTQSHADAIKQTLVDSDIELCRRAKQNADAAQDTSVDYVAVGKRIISDAYAKAFAWRRGHTNSDAHSIKEALLGMEHETAGFAQRTSDGHRTAAVLNEALIGFEVDASGSVREVRRAKTHADVAKETLAELEHVDSKRRQGVVVAGQLALQPAVQHSFSIAGLRQSFQSSDDSIVALCIILVFIFLIVYLFGKKFVGVYINRKFEYRNNLIARSSLQTYLQDNAHPSWQSYMDNIRVADIPLKERWFEMMIDVEFANQIDVLFDAVQRQKAEPSAVSRQGAIFNREDIELVSLSLEEEINLGIVGQRPRKIICTVEVIADNLDWLYTSWEESYPSHRPLDRTAFQDLFRLIITHKHHRNVIYALMSSFVLPFWANLEVTSCSSFADLGIESFSSTVRAKISEEPITLLQIRWNASGGCLSDDFPDADEKEVNFKTKEKRLSCASSFCPTSSDESLHIED